jgi:hypothetical protein
MVAGGSGFGLTVPGFRRLPCRGGGFSVVPIGFASLFAVELATAGSVHGHAPTPLSMGVEHNINLLKYRFLI